jgi:hypothetical protein
MKGASGAGLKLTGDIVTKTCKDAQQQADWFATAAPLLPAGVRTPRVISVTDSSYVMEFISGHEATRDSTLSPIKNCLGMVRQLSQRGPTQGTIDDYLTRCEEHIKYAGKEHRCLHQAFSWLVRDAHLLHAGFCHGDLTLENVLVSGGSLVVIDPNNKPGLFMSPALDHGKLLQSTHARYHDVFDSHKGCSLSRHARFLEKHLRETGEWRAAIVACASHIIRLRRYNPGREHLADGILEQLLKNYS